MHPDETLGLLADAAQMARLGALAAAGGPPVVGAIATAKVALAAVLGRASTFLPTDSVLALDQAIAPTWSGFHTHSDGWVSHQNTQNGAYSFLLPDAGASVVNSTVGAVTWTIQPDATTNFPVGTIIWLASGFGQITVARGAGVSLYLSGTTVDSDKVIPTAALSISMIYKNFTNQWIFKP